MNPNNAISTIMSTEIISVKPNTKLAEVEKKFKSYPIHHLPVVDENYTVVGIISKMDMLQIARAIEHDASGKIYIDKVYNSWTAGRIMTPNPLFLDPDDSIGLVADIFLQNKFHAIPVVEDGRLVGIVTSHDLLQYAYEKITFPQIDNTLES
ncbi:MAG: CBS domain-containing protein [Saprospiraceae bacterium]